MKANRQTFRLNSFLSRAGIAARRKCDELIKTGRITVNGKIVLDPGVRIDPDDDRVLFDTKPVALYGNYSYILLNKPKGFVCTVNDEQKRPTVFDLVSSDTRIFPVGRLDMSTTGLLLLTDDGELSYRLTHPKYKIDKIYVAELHKPLTEEHKERFQKGVNIGEKENVSAHVRVIGRRGANVQITVHEGRNRMLRRMFDSLGYKVKSLDRVNYAGLSKKKLPRGGWRTLTKSEIQRLYKIVGL